MLLNPDSHGGTASVPSVPPSANIPTHILTSANELLCIISEDTPLAVTRRVGRKQITITVDAAEPIPFDDEPQKHEFL